jgi:hypothetical protein
LTGRGRMGAGDRLGEEELAANEFGRYL